MYRNYRHIDDERLQRWVLSGATALSLALGTVMVLVVAFHK